MAIKKIEELLGKEADNLLNHKSKTITAEQIHHPGPEFVDRSFWYIEPQHTGVKEPYKAFMAWPFGKYRLCIYSYLLTRVLSTRQVHHSPQTQFILILKTL